MECFGIRLKKLREARNITIEQLAEMLDVGDMLVQYFEDGKLEFVGADTLIKLSNIFGVTTDYLLGL